MSNVIPLKQKLKFSDIFANNKIKPIKWGDEFNDWPIEKQVSYAKSLASAMNEAADKMQQDRDRVFNLMTSAQTQKEEAEHAMNIAKQTMTKSIIDSNEQVQKLQKQIMLLQDRVKAQDELIEKLGNS